MRELRMLFKGILMFVLFLLPCFASASYGSSSTTEVVLTQQEFITLQQNLKELENINNNQLSTITKLETQLQTASLSTSELQMQLIEAKISLTEQHNQLQTANQKLAAQEKVLNEQAISLAKAEVYLNEQKREIKKTQYRQRKSNILIVGLGIALVAMAVK